MPSATTTAAPSDANPIALEHRRGCGSGGPSRDPARRSPAHRLRRRPSPTRRALERTRGAPGRRVLPEIDRRIEEPGRARSPPRVNGIEAVHVAPLAADRWPVPLVVAMGPSTMRSTTPRSRTGTIKCATPVGHDLRVARKVRRVRDAERARQPVSGRRPWPRTQAALGPSRSPPASPSRPIDTGTGQHAIADLLSDCRTADGCPARRRPAGGQPPHAPSALWPAPTTSSPVAVNDRSRLLALVCRTGSTNVVSDWLNSRAISRITSFGERRGVADDRERIARQRSLGEHVDERERERRWRCASSLQRRQARRGHPRILDSLAPGLRRIFARRGSAKCPAC